MAGPKSRPPKLPSEVDTSLGSQKTPESFGPEATPAADPGSLETPGGSELESTTYDVQGLPALSDVDPMGALKWSLAIDDTEDHRLASDSGTQVHTIAWAAGQKVGRYELEQFLGKGAFGEVWTARDGLLGRVVAVKIPRADRVRSAPWLTQAFWAEARTAARVAALGCGVPIHDFGWEGFTAYIVMQRMETNLSDLAQDGRLDVREVCQLVAVAARRLHRAHLEGIVHCDIKPSNLLVDTLGEVFPADFSTAVPRAWLSAEAHYVAGTLPYMAPEQLIGRTYAVDCRTDCYALGVLLYELLTGHRPFPHHDPLHLSAAIRAGNYRPVRHFRPHCPRLLEELIARCLAWSKARRPSDARSIAEVLEAAARDGRPLYGHAAPRHQGPRRPHKRQRRA
jgi:serine/threonine protein kinase